MAELNAREQLFLELINRARMDPQGEVARQGLADLNAGLAPGTISAQPKQVLAPNALLTDAARGHSQWMLDVDSFSHTGAGGTNPGQRMSTAGYVFAGTWSWAENISWSGSTGNFDANAAVASQHRGLFLSAGHRQNTLGDAFREVGIGALTGLFNGSPPDSNTYSALMTTQNFARSGSGAFVTGVTYNDTDNNNFYSIGEGVGGRIFELLSGGAVIGSTVSAASGGYALAVSGIGSYEVHVTGPGLNADVGANLVLNGTNIKIDLTDNNTIETNASAILTRSSANLTLIGVQNLAGYGNNLNNSIVGNGGDNTIYGLAGNDTVDGAGGNDVLLGGDGQDLIRGGAGADTILGEAGVDFLYGDAGNDVLWGGTEGDTISGDDGLDWLLGQSGNDVLIGGYGINVYVGDDGVDVMYPNVSTLETQVFYGGADNDTATGSEGTDWFLGGEGNDTYWGRGGSDMFYGEAGNDHIHLDEANVPIVPGGDYAWGGAGEDRFYANAVLSGVNVIMDFSAADGDMLVLSQSAYASYAQLAAASVESAGYLILPLNPLYPDGAIYLYGFTSAELTSANVLLV